MKIILRTDPRAYATIIKKSVIWPNSAYKSRKNDRRPETLHWKMLRCMSTMKRTFAIYIDWYCPDCGNSTQFDSSVSLYRDINIGTKLTDMVTCPRCYLQMMYESDAPHDDAESIQPFIKKTRLEGIKDEQKRIGS